MHLKFNQNKSLINVQDVQIIDIQKYQDVFGVFFSVFLGRYKKI